jgi:hypothetical protein
MKEIERRALAVKATQKRFENRPFDWRRSATCIHLLRFHARQMGHNVPTVPRFRSALTARRALEDMGHDGLASLMDAHFERIPPAFCRVGDVMALPGDSAFDALVVRAGVNKWIGWHQDAEGCTVVSADMCAAIGAWRL